MENSGLGIRETMWCKDVFKTCIPIQVLKTSLTLYVVVCTESAFPEKYEKKNTDSVLQHLYPFAKLLQTQAKSVNFFQIESIFGGFFLHLASARLVLRRRYRH